MPAAPSSSAMSGGAAGLVGRGGRAALALPRPAGWACGSTRPGTAAPGLRRRRLRHDRRQLDQGEGFTLARDAPHQPASNYSPGLPLFVAGVYKLSGGVHERCARLMLALLGALAVLFTYLIGRRLSGPAAGLIGAAAIADLPGPTRVPGHVDERAAGGDVVVRGSAGDILGSGRRPGSAAMAIARRAARALALVRPEYLGVALLVSLVVLLREGWRDWSRTWFKPCCLARGGGDRGALDRAQRGRARPLRAGLDRRRASAVCTGPTCPRMGIRKRCGDEGGRAAPELFGPERRASICRLEQILARSGRAALSGNGNRQGALEDGQGTALGRHQRRAARIRGLSWRQDRADLVARAARR